MTFSLGGLTHRTILHPLAVEEIPDMTKVPKSKKKITRWNRATTGIVLAVPLMAWLLWASFRTETRTEAGITNADSALTSSVSESQGQDSGPATSPSKNNPSSALASLDPRKDGWLTEHFNEVAGKVLKKVGRLIAEHRVAESESLLGQLVTDEITANLLPASEQLMLAYDDGKRKVWKWQGTTTPEKMSEGIGARPICRIARGVGSSFFNCGPATDKIQSHSCESK